jgi:hypothetical protein
MAESKPTFADEINEILRRIHGDVPHLPAVLPRQVGDPEWMVRIGNENTLTICDAPKLRQAVAMMRAGAPTGEPGNAPEGTVWRAMNRAIVSAMKF